jgi:ATP-dependent Clp protease ATP-binding subunit ClpX
MTEIDTTNILFIAGGAFVGLSGIVKSRINGTTIGFTGSVGTREDVDLDLVNPDDLVRFGLIPEFVGRFPGIVTLKKLERVDMIRILTEVKNNYIDQYQWLFAQDGVELTFTTAALDTLVDRAMTLGTGARALHSEIERTLMPHMFNLRRYVDRGISSIRIDVDNINTPAAL